VIPAESSFKSVTIIGYKLFSWCSFSVATTGPFVYYSQSPAYNSQYLLRTAATNVTPTKVRTNVSAPAISTDLFKTTVCDSVCSWI